MGDSKLKSKLQILVAEYWADWLGIELNEDKREPVQASTRHLGFFLDLTDKMLSVTEKHKRKIIAQFNRFLSVVRRRDRIRVNKVQRMLGLQIWISTVFTLARQFLTSVCDVIRIAADEQFFYPRKHKALTSRVIFDLKFWRRFIASNPRATFRTILDRLPSNTHTLACDACTSWGMAGIITFGGPDSDYPRIDGLFWQMTWAEWNEIYHTPHLAPGGVIINVAEFLAALITCETFAEFCSQKATTLSIDSRVAKAWLDSYRCPRHPFDRCAQAVHLYMMDRSMKLHTTWVSSGDNSVADIFSRRRFSARSTGHEVNGRRFRKIKPSWTRVVKFL